MSDARPDLKNGRPVVYHSSTRAGHKKHVHCLQVPAEVECRDSHD